MFSYLPLAHGYETAVEFALMILGSRITYYSGSLHMLVDDLKYAKPSLFIAVPRVLQNIQQTILETFQKQSWIKRKIIRWCLWRQTLAHRKGYRIALYDKLVFNQIKNTFGGNIKCFASGAAPLSGELSEFLQVCFGVPILEGYGLTETAAACSMTINNGHVVYYSVGTPLCGQEICLRSVPEMGYTTEDTPYPRGEVLVRGPAMFNGYYKNPELTKKVVEPDGWFHTGDIGQINPDGGLSVIDRIKSLLKLSQGEYVATERVEAVFSECAWVSQVFIYGNSYENCLVAVAAPNPHLVIPYARSIGLPVKDTKEEGWQEALAAACCDPQVVAKVKDELNAYGKKMGLKGFEMIKGLYVDGHLGAMNQIFAVENGLMTPTFKLKRKACFDKYQPIIKQLYEEIHKKKLTVCWLLHKVYN